MFVDDVALKLRGRDDIAVAKLKVLDEKACAVERLLTADAGKPLIDLMLKLDVTLQARCALELVTTYPTCLVVLFRACNLVHGIILEGVEVLVTLVTVLVFVRVLLVVLHHLFGLEGHAAILVGTLDASDRLERGWHLGFVGCGGCSVC
jgi:hypothetical protein